MLIDVRFRGLDMTTEEIDTTMREWSARAASGFRSSTAPSDVKLSCWRLPVSLVAFRPWGGG